MYHFGYSAQSLWKVHAEFERVPNVITLERFFNSVLEWTIYHLTASRVYVPSGTIHWLKERFQSWTDCWTFRTAGFVQKLSRIQLVINSHQTLCRGSSVPHARIGNISKLLEGGGEICQAQATTKKNGGQSLCFILFRSPSSFRSYIYKMSEWTVWFPVHWRKRC